MIPMTLFLVLAAAASLSSAVAASPAPSHSWKALAPGLEFRAMEGGSGCRRGSPLVVVVRADPAQRRLDIFHESEARAAPGDRSLDIAGWQQRTGAAVIFNAGQYTPDRRHMGLFARGGSSFGTGLKSAWKGLLLAGPGIALLDLELDGFDPLGDTHAVKIQSFMLLDRNGKKRVRRSDWLANRTVVAMTREDRLLVLVTEGAWSLWDLADWIARSDLGVRHAMSLDGGFESQLAIRSQALDYTTYGQFSVDDRGDHSIPGLRVSLPAVVALF